MVAFEIKNLTSLPGLEMSDRGMSSGLAVFPVVGTMYTDLAMGFPIDHQ